MHLDLICFCRLGWITPIGIIRLGNIDGFFRAFWGVLGFSLGLLSSLFREGFLVMKWIRGLLSSCFRFPSKIGNISPIPQQILSAISHHSPKYHKIPN